MRILYLNHNTAGVGTWQRASNLGRAMAARGHQVTLLTTHPYRRTGFEATTTGSYTEVRVPDLLIGRARTGWDPTNVARRIGYLRGRSYDLVHAFDSRPVVILPALWARRRVGAPLFIDWADWWGRGGLIRDRSGWVVRTFFGPVETWFEEAFRTGADGTTTISGALAERARRLGVDPALVWTLPNGCDHEGIRPGDRERARRLLDVPPETPLVLHVGVLTPPDMAQLAEAFRLVEVADPAARLVLVGNHTAPLPRALIESPGARAVGFVAPETLALWLAAADLCVVPLVDSLSNRGRWPGRINDYMAAGRPTVLPSVGDAAEMIRRREAGWTCAPVADDLARTLLRALRDPEARRVAGRKARELATGEMAWSVLAERLEAAYNAILARRSQTGAIEATLITPGRGGPTGLPGRDLTTSSST